MKKKNRRQVAKRSFTRKAAAAAVAGALAVAALTACGKSSETISDGGVEKVIIGSAIGMEGWANIDENGVLDGYEIAVLREIDERLPQYEFEIQGSDFNNVLISLDTGKIDLGTCMFEYNEERAEKYLYGKEGYIDFTTRFVLPVDSAYTTWDSLAGKVFGVTGETGNDAVIAKQYNAEHPDKALELEVVGNIGAEARIKGLLEGRWDALSSLTWEIDKMNRDYGNGEDIVKAGDVIGTSESYYLYPKDGKHEELQTAVDGVLKEIKEDGTLKEISIKYFQIDVTPNEN